MGNGASGGEGGGGVSQHRGAPAESYTRVGSLAGSRQGTARGPASLAGSGYAPRYAHKSLVVGGAHGAGSRRPSDASSAMFRQSLKSTSLAPPLLRKMRSAALGRKIACTVHIDKNGFSLQHIQICQGQLIGFEWDEVQDRGFNVMQVMNDGAQYRPVIGGYNSGPVRKKGSFHQQFNLEGKFKFVSAGLKVTPLTVDVYPRKPVEAELTDDGFLPPLIRIDEGHSVNWLWSSCEVPRYVFEAKFCHRTGTVHPMKDLSNTTDRPIPTKAGSYLQQFNKPGVYYFQTEGNVSGDYFTCIVHVRECQREYEIQILDREFDPPILVIQEGDRVWWHWEQDKSKRNHCVYQIEPPPISHSREEAYQQYKNGFRWPTPSRSGLMSYEFYEPGVYFFSDHNFDQAAEYLGTVIVKPKQTEHFITLSPQGFSEDILYAESGDRIWWTWGRNDIDAPFSVQEIEKCISPASLPKKAIEEVPSDKNYMDNELQRLKVASGVETLALQGTGVYHFRLSDSVKNVSTCSIVSSPGQRNHTIHVSDTGFKPKVLTVHPDDRVWWVWQSCKKQHSITQVSHQGTVIDSGFCSGAPRDSPSAHMKQFNSPGIYYYVSAGVTGFCGAIVVTSQPKVLEVQVSEGSFSHNPALLAVNDVVMWSFPGLRHNDVSRVHTVAEVLDAQNNSVTISPRRCMNRLFTESGTYHFASKSFIKHGKRQDGKEERRLSSIIVDDVSDSAIVRVTTTGFCPSAATVHKGNSILFSWKNSEDAHNIIHVNPPESDSPLAIVQGGQSFNSGRPVADNSFMYTFDATGVFAVASQGAPGFAATFTVVENAQHVETPYVMSKKKAGNMEYGSIVHLGCNTPNSIIYYTIDGVAPEMHKINIKLYSPEKGVVLRKPGLCFVRAVAMADGHLNSPIFTSKRFTVQNGDVKSDSEPERPKSPTIMEKSSAKLWWNCVPKIRACFTSPGTMELFWDEPPPEAKDIIRSYQIFLNGITYCEMFPPEHNSLSVTGMAGGRLYECVLEVFPVDAMFLPHRSNKLVMKCPKSNSTGGPIISLETTEASDSLAIVWMSISASDAPIAGYRVYLNSTMCGSQVVPDEGNDRCKVVIEGCKTNFLYRVQVSANPIDNLPPKMSNELEVSLPLESEFITLPPEEIRINDKDLYKEYLEVREGSGYQPRDQLPFSYRNDPPICPIPVVDNRPRVIPLRPYVKKHRGPVIIKCDNDDEIFRFPVPTPTIATNTECTPTVSYNDDDLPRPNVSAESNDASMAMVTWKFDRLVPEASKARLIVCAVNVIGQKFSNEVTSDISFECIIENMSNTVTGLQHVWNITSGDKCLIKGLIAGNKYTIYVMATYNINGIQSYEYQTKSNIVEVITVGPPDSPVLRISSVDLCQVCVSWEMGLVHDALQLRGFRLLLDGEPMGHVIDKDTRKSTIDSLVSGKTVNISIMALTTADTSSNQTNPNIITSSGPSNIIKVTCPSVPETPQIALQPSYKRGTVIVAWEKPHCTVSSGDDIVYYRVYVDGQMNGEIKSNSESNRNGYQYCLNTANIGQSYDINVKSFAGQRTIEATAQHVYCMQESLMSATLSATAPAPPESPHLRIEGLHCEGVDVTWTMPQQFGDASVSGYQMMKDGKLYGSIIPADVHSLRIKDINLGDTIKLQLLALTDHPVGRKSDFKQQDGVTTENDSGIDANTYSNTESKQPHYKEGYTEIFIGGRYSACQPGPRLTICYTGLVQKPSNVHVEKVTGHSALIVWDKVTRPVPHYVAPEKYQVTWWPGNNADRDVQSVCTSSDNVSIDNLITGQTYTVVVEARCLQKYRSLATDTGRELAKDDPDGRHFSTDNTFILTAKSAPLTVECRCPPSAVSNLGIVGTTCQSISVGWHAPNVNGLDIVVIRVDAVATRKHPTQRRDHSCVEVLPDATSAILEHLDEMREYLVTVTMVTDEYFANCADKDAVADRMLSRKRPPPRDHWLPSAGVVATTSGTEAPNELRIIRTGLDYVKLSWYPPRVYGSNRLQGTIVRWSVVKSSQQSLMTTGCYGNDALTSDDLSTAPMCQHRSVMADCNEALIDGLVPGLLYKIVVEAVVSVKTTMNAGHTASDHRMTVSSSQSQSHSNDLCDLSPELANRRTAHVLCPRALLVRTRAPCDPPRPIIVTRYDCDSVQLYWERPTLWRTLARDGRGNERYMRLSLEGYRLEVNGKPHVRLSSSAQSCNLVKCKPGKEYSIVLVALTCTEEVKRERRRKLKNEPSLKDDKDYMDSLDNDESPADPVLVRIPRKHDGFLSVLRCVYMVPDSGVKLGAKDFGDIKVEWALQGDLSNVEQLDLTWKCYHDNDYSNNYEPTVERRILAIEERSANINVKNLRGLVDITLEPRYRSDVIVSPAQKVQVLLPGRPDAPILFTRAINSDEFVVEWAEPKLYAVKVKGYQIYLNDKKVGNILSSHHRKAVIPCKPRRHYQVSLVALSADGKFNDSPPSRVLHIDSHPVADGHPGMLQTGTGQYTNTVQGISYEKGHEVIVRNENYLNNSNNNNNTTLSHTQSPLSSDNEECYSDLKVKIESVTDAAIHLNWLSYARPSRLSHYKVTWSSVAQPSEKEVILRADERSCVLHKCYPGSYHYVRIHAIGEDGSVLDRSKQLVIQSSAAPDTPIVSVRASNFKYVAIEWQKPAEFGEAKISGYKVFVNGIVEAQLAADQFTYTYNHGVWCREYVFQVQAITLSDHLSSKPSEPLEIKWPGVQPPTLEKAAPVNGNSVRVKWTKAQCTDGIKIKYYKVICLDEHTDRPVQVISPIHADINEAELHNLKRGSYNVYLEVHIHGSHEIVKSDCIQIKPSVTPDAPQITVTVIGLEERRQIEKVTCDLINSRDRLLSRLYNTEFTNEKNRSENIEQLRNNDLEQLSQVEDKLDDCLSSLAHYTGHLLAHISWCCVQSNPDLEVSGYKVLVDGKQYGTTLHAGVKNVRIKLGLNQTSYRLTMVSVVDRPHAVSVPSTGVELLTSPFKPFSFYTFLAQAPKRITTSQHWEPQFTETLTLERHLTTRRMLANVGLLKRGNLSTPHALLMDIFEARYRPLFPSSGPRQLTAVLCWATWCTASQKILEWFVKFARSNSNSLDFVAMACEPEAMTSADQQRLIHVISENGWREDACIRHVTSKTAESSINSKANTASAAKHNSGLTEGENIERPPDTKLGSPIKASTESFESLVGVVGVPTILIVHPDDYVAWKGRYCAFDYSAFEGFMQHILQLCGSKISYNVADPWSPNLIELYDMKSPRINSNMIHTLSHITNGSAAKTQAGTTIHFNAQRPKSAKQKLFTRSTKEINDPMNSQISVNSRPYSSDSYSHQTKSNGGSKKGRKRSGTKERRTKSGRATLSETR